MGSVLPNRIRELRENRQLALRDLANLAGMDVNKIHRLETGGIKLDHDSMRRVAKGLGVKPSALLPDEDVELRADELTAAMFKELAAIPEEERLNFLQMAQGMVRLARGMAASGTALEGPADQVAQLTASWNGFRPEDRERALGILRLAATN